MPSGMQLGQMVLVNGADFLRGIEDAKKLQLSYMRTELKRGANRIRKSFIQTWLHGPPGIDAPNASKGKQVRTYVKGDDAKHLFAEIAISRFLNIHEQGVTIMPKQGDVLYLIEHRQRGTGGEIVATAPRIVIPARLRFRQHVAAESPAVLRKTAEAGVRASDVALSKALKRTAGRI